MNKEEKKEQKKRRQSLGPPHLTLPHPILMYFIASVHQHHSQLLRKAHMSYELPRAISASHDGI